MCSKNEKHRYIWVALKTNIGHLEPAAGLAGIIKVLLCFQNRFLPPNLHMENVNPYIEPFVNNPIQFPDKHGTVLCNTGHIYASVSSFGFGGTNGHVVLQSSSEHETVRWNAVEWDYKYEPILDKLEFDYDIEQVSIVSSENIDSERGIEVVDTGTSFKFLTRMECSYELEHNEIFVSNFLCLTEALSDTSSSFGFSGTESIIESIQDCDFAFDKSE